MYIKRKAEKVILEYLDIFPVIAITGPRQAGKSTLLQHVLTDYQYVSFDEDDVVKQFTDDPQEFLKRYSGKVIFDEVQRVPTIFGYIKRVVDKHRKDYGRFVLTGSCQFSLMNQITESLAGRIGFLTLLPLQCSEVPRELQEMSIYRGAYPEVVSRHYQYAHAWYSSYVMSYLEKDVRRLANISDIREFRRLIHLLAAHVGQTLNMSLFARELGLSVDTIKRWISLLETSYIIYLLPPYFNNLGKRITKSPKIYFYDTGLVAYLTGVETEALFHYGPLSGPLFENYVVIDVIKNCLHSHIDASFYFIRTNTQDEVDLIIDTKTKQLWLEIKKSSTYHPRMLKNIKSLKPDKEEGILIYTGETLPDTSDLRVINYRDFLLE